MYNIQTVLIFLQDKKYSMIVMLPLDGTKLSAMLQKLEAMPFRNVMEELDESALEFEDEVTHVYLPRFKYGSDFVLNVILEQVRTSFVVIIKNQKLFI